MLRRAVLLLAAGIALAVLPGAVMAEGAAGKKIKAVYWTGGTAHDYDAMTKVLPPVLTKLIDVDLKVCTDASWLDKPDAKQLDVIVMNHCHTNAKNILTETQKRTLLELVRGGVGVVAVHASYYSFVKWDEIRKFYGARFKTHASAKARVKVKTVDAKHPITKGLGDSFEVVSELYISTPLAKGCHLLATANEDDKDEWHPSIWTRMYGKGRVVTLLPGHWADSFKVKGFQQVIARSVQWAAGRLAPSKG